MIRFIIILAHSLPDVLVIYLVLFFARKQTQVVLLQCESRQLACKLAVSTKQFWSDFVIILPKTSFSLFFLLRDLAFLPQMSLGESISGKLACDTFYSAETTGSWVNVADFGQFFPCFSY